MNFILSRPKDLRKSQRRKLGRAAWIRLSGGFAVRTCEVLDMSDTGARILVPGQDAVPGTFTLALERGREGRAVRVKWRRGAQVGLEFSAASTGRG